MSQLKKLKSRLPIRLQTFSPRDLLMVALPLLLIVLAGFWYASRYIKPAPPDTLVLSTGGAGGAYERFGAAYKDVLARYGVNVVEKTSAGSTENLARLRDPAQDVDAAFVQGGTASQQEGDEIVSLGVLYNEPLWIFYRAELEQEQRALTRLTDLRGRRLAIGGAGSGTRHLTQELLYASQIDPTNTKLLETGGLGLVQAFATRRIDAAFVVGTAESAAVWTLLHTPGLRLMSLSHAEAYSRRFPYLTRLVLPRGAIDMAGDVPPRDVQMLASTANLVVREGTHPALIDMLLEAMGETHGTPGLFQRAREFPRAAGVDFPLAPAADRYYKSGKPILQRYLPFWAATLLDRMLVMLIPLITVLIPVIKFAPGLYNWRIKSRIYERYGELKFIEAELGADPSSLTRQEWLARVDAIERDVNRLPVPLTFTDMIYTLRSHIGLVRTTIERATQSETTSA